MNCACSYEAEGYCDFESTEWRRARLSTHRCNECRRKISTGEEYEYCSGKYEGEFFVHKTCESCVGWRERFYAVTRCNVYFGAIVEAVREMASECEAGNWLIAQCLCASPPVLPPGEPFDYHVYRMTVKGERP